MSRWYRGPGVRTPGGARYRASRVTPRGSQSGCPCDTGASRFGCPGGTGSEWRRASCTRYMGSGVPVGRGENQFGYPGRHRGELGSGFPVAPGAQSGGRPAKCKGSRFPGGTQGVDSDVPVTPGARGRGRLARCTGSGVPVVPGGAGLTCPKDTRVPASPGATGESRVSRWKGPGCERRAGLTLGATRWHRGEAGRGGTPGGGRQSEGSRSWVSRDERDARAPG